MIKLSILVFWLKVENFQKHIITYEKGSAILLKKIDNELLHNGKLEFLNSEIWKTKIKYYDDKVNTKFYKKNANTRCTLCLVVNNFNRIHL